MVDLYTWASRRWDARNAEPDYGVQTPMGDIHLGQALADLDRRRVDLRTAISSLGADAALLDQLEAFEAAAAIAGMVIGANRSLDEVHPLPATGSNSPSNPGGKFVPPL
ncbi:hypothetical protein AAIB33_07345 [Microbacterium sp. AZCO]|uniref:hypothetical protein n=1 Tax=Microbacterium sp. AZCO TaxID=3142976 RepID=UPI0031F3B279